MIADMSLVEFNRIVKLVHYFGHTIETPEEQRCLSMLLCPRSHRS